MVLAAGVLAVGIMPSGLIDVFSSITQDIF